MTCWALTCMKTYRWLALVMVLTLASCRCPETFKDVQVGAPHAMLRETKYPNAGNAFPSHINGQPVSFWRWQVAFRIPDGKTTCVTAYSDRRETVGYKTLQFVASQGCNYTISRRLEHDSTSPLTATPHPTTANAWIIHDRRDRMTIRESRPDGVARIVAEVPRQECVFGFPLAADAIAGYREKRP